MQQILEAIQQGASGADIAALPIPQQYRAAHVLASEQEMWAGIASKDKDPQQSIHIGEVPTPELAPDEAYVAVMASSINFNTVWTSIFEPISTFGALKRLARESEWARRHDLPYHVVGSDASGVVLRVGSAVRNWKPGDRVTVHCNHVDDQDPSSHDDSIPRTSHVAASASFIGASACAAPSVSASEATLLRGCAPPTPPSSKGVEERTIPPDFHLLTIADQRGPTARTRTLRPWACSRRSPRETEQ